MTEQDARTLEHPEHLTEREPSARTEPEAFDVEQWTADQDLRRQKIDTMARLLRQHWDGDCCEQLAVCLVDSGYALIEEAMVLCSMVVGPRSSATVKLVPETHHIVVDIYSPRESFPPDEAHHLALVERP